MPSTMGSVSAGRAGGALEVDRGAPGAEPGATNRLGERELGDRSGALAGAEPRLTSTGGVERALGLPSREMGASESGEDGAGRKGAEGAVEWREIGSDWRTNPAEPGGGAVGIPDGENA